MTVPERSVIWNCPWAAPFCTACDSVAYCPEGQFCPAPQVATQAPGDVCRKGTVNPELLCSSMRVSDTRLRRTHGASDGVVICHPAGTPTCRNCAVALVGR